MTQEIVTLQTAEKLGLNKEEFEKIKEYLGRTPNFTELSIYSVMWSEHASYKNSIKWLKTLPRTGKQIMVEAGEENAGMVQIDEDTACVFKIESHNHPSAVAPYQGAATGVGGINRDIFTMGARPIAQLNSLRFGNPYTDRTKWLLEGVVKGIGDYGNAFGVPVAGGEIYFDDSYNTNPLVNAMSVGIVKRGQTASATSYGEGNPIFIVGSSTGKDGIHGATFASADLHEDSADDIPSVQVGDPFQEKLLLEATLEVIKSGTIIGVQDMGAAGIICSTSEMSEKGKSGMKIDLDKVPLRQKNMEAWEILLSESQERMLITGKKGKEKEIIEIFKKWDLNCEQIGEVINEDRLLFYKDNELQADVPASTLVLGGGAPVYEREYKEPAYIKEIQKFNIDNVAEPEDIKKTAKFLISHPNIASKKWAVEQYDTMVRTNNTNTNAPADAGIVYLKETKSALAVTTDCNSTYVYADPEVGAQIAVSEAARNIVCSGAEPLAITNCLNFGNPYNPEAYWQFVKAVQGMGKACAKFNTPVTGGNVSFYNQTNIKGKIEPVYPTPTIGMLGLIQDGMRKMTLSFVEEGDLIFMLGKSRNDISQSQYLRHWHEVKLSPAPYFNLEEEYEMQNNLKKFIKEDLIASAHDVSEGGLFVALCEAGFYNNKGFNIKRDKEIRQDAFLFGEAQSRVVVSIKPVNLDKFKAMAEAENCTYSELGTVTQGDLIIDNQKFGDIAEYKDLYENSISKIVED